MQLQKIVKLLNQKSKKVAPLGGTLKIDFGGEYIFINGYNKNVISTENKAAECTIKITKENFIKLYNGQISPAWSVITGKIRIEGNRKILNNLKGLLKN